MDGLRTEWFDAYRAAMADAVLQDRPSLVEVAVDLMHRRAQQIANDHGSHVEKRLMLDAMATLNQRWNHQAA